jgi:hypothetical protein
MLPLSCIPFGFLGTSCLLVQNHFIVFSPQKLPAPECSLATKQQLLSSVVCIFQARGSQASHQVLRDILKDVQCNMVPRSMLRDWAVRTFPAATDYWMFRKMVRSLAD